MKYILYSIALCMSSVIVTAENSCFSITRSQKSRTLKKSFIQAYQEGDWKLIEDKVKNNHNMHQLALTTKRYIDVPPTAHEEPTDFIETSSSVVDKVLQQRDVTAFNSLIGLGLQLDQPCKIEESFQMNFVQVARHKVECREICIGQRKYYPQDYLGNLTESYSMKAALQEALKKQGIH